VSSDIPAGYNTPIPATITTPDSVDTRIGTLTFRDGFPSADTATLVYDHLDFLRGVEAFLSCVPAASVEALRAGLESVGLTACHKVWITQELLDSAPLFLTGNTDTVYAVALLDLHRDGPTVVEVPPGCGPGTVDDAWFRFVVDMGMVGPDRGAGGKYLIVPPGYDGDLPESGYFVAPSPTYSNCLILRGFLVDGKPDAATELFEKELRVYPLSAADNPPTMQTVAGSKVEMNTIHSNTIDYYHELSRVIRREPIDMIDPETRGLLASIGIHKDHPFDPDERMQRLLNDAAAVGNATARAIAFKTRDPAAFMYPDRAWKTGFIGGDYQWLLDGGRGGRNLDARTFYFYIATVNTPAMAAEMIGAGSQYALLEVDGNGEYLDGGRNYRLRLPADAPAKQFWSLVVYDPQTRSELQTGQTFPGRDSMRDPIVFNDDGTVDMTFGPTEPADRSANWIQTVEGKGWFVVLRLYGPLEPWFERTWKPGNIERT